MHLNQKGFTLIELLVATTVFVIVMIGVYFLFDQGRWYYLAADKKSNMQEMGRLAMEQMERDFRMIGYGVPRAGSTSANTDRWVPAIFGITGGSTSATAQQIGFVGDIDNGAEILRNDVGTDSHNDWVFVDSSQYYNSYLTDIGNVPAVLIADRRKWEAVTVNGLESAGKAVTLAGAVSSPSTFTADRSEIYTIERVCYVLTGDPTAAPNYASLKRSVLTTNTLADRTNLCPVAADASYQTIATNITNFNLTYYSEEGTTTADMDTVGDISIDLTITDRNQNVGDTNSYSLHSDVVLRMKKS